MYKYGYGDRFLFFVNDRYETAEDFRREPSPLREEYRAYVAHGVIYNLEGKLEIRVEGSQYILNPGDVFIVHDTEAHTVVPIEYPSEYFDMSFSLHYFRIPDPDFRLYRAFTERPLGVGNVIRADCLNENLFLECFGVIARTTDTYMRRIAVMNAIALLLCEINRLHLPENYAAPARRDPFAVKILEYITDNLGEDLEPATLASKFYVSRSQLNRLVKSGTGFTLWHYITCKRLSRTYYLVRSGISNKEAAALSGFQDYSTFYKAHMRIKKFPPKNDRPSENFDPFLTNFYQLDEQNSKMI